MSDLALNIPWHKYGLITSIVNKLQGKSPQVGKTVIMKFIYILQDVYNVPSGYDFSLYTYGPYCSDILNDLEYVDVIKGVKIYNSNHGYNIQPGEEVRELLNRADGFLQQYNQIIDKAVDLFGSMNAKELELRSTIIFLKKQKDRQSGLGELVGDVKDVKPNFSNKEIQDACIELLSKGLFKIH